MPCTLKNVKVHQSSGFYASVCNMVTGRILTHYLSHVRNHRIHNVRDNEEVNHCNASKSAIKRLEERLKIERFKKKKLGQQKVLDHVFII